MSRASLSIAYDGPALREHTMDVRDLAPALLGLGQLFDAMNAALNGDSAHVRVQVKAAEPGCFQITFEVVQSLGEHLVALMTSQPVTAAANLVGPFAGSIASVTASGVGLIQLVRWLRGRAIDRVESVPNDTVRLSIGDETLEVPLALLRLCQDVAVRDAAQRVVEEPLRKEGIDSFEARDGDRVLVRVTREEAIFFVRPQVPEITLIDNTRRSAFSIISLAFKEDNKWRLNDGTNAISAGIEDSDFLARVDANQISFSKGDILICDVRVVQKQTESGLRTEYTVVKVVEHRLAARQLPLPGMDPVSPAAPSAA